jgi:hypothetical protein
MLVGVESKVPTAHTLFGVAPATAESTLESTLVSSPFAGRLVRLCSD